MKVDDSCNHPVPHRYILGIAMFPHPGTMERKPQTCDNPDGHRLEEGEGTKDQAAQNNHGILPQVMFPFQRQWFLTKYLKDIAMPALVQRKGLKNMLIVECRSIFNFYCNYGLSLLWMPDKESSPSSGDLI